jgi:hypothetical protein
MYKEVIFELQLIISFTGRCETLCSLRSEFLLNALQKYQLIMQHVETLSDKDMIAYQEDEENFCLLYTVFSILAVFRGFTNCKFVIKAQKYRHAKCTIKGEADSNAQLERLFKSAYSQVALRDFEHSLLDSSHSRIPFDYLSRMSY